MENNTIIEFSKQENSKDVIESKKQSIESARYSSDAMLRDETIRKSLARGAGGILGMLIFFKSIGNTIQDIKSKQLSPWSISRTILDFSASGALIGLAINKTLYGIIFGISIGTLTLLAETIIFYKNKKIN